METLIPLLDSSVNLNAFIGVWLIIQQGKISQRLAVLEALSPSQKPQ